MDVSEVELGKARRLAEARGVEIATVHADLAVFEIEHQQWDVIVSIFCHLLPERRRDVQEGEFHDGPGAVLQALAGKP